MQRKVPSRNKSNDEYTKINGRMINIIFITLSLKDTQLRSKEHKVVDYRMCILSILFGRYVAADCFIIYRIRLVS